MKVRSLLAVLLLVLSVLLSAQESQKRSKPQAPASQREDWSTPAELSGYRSTPRYDETMAYVRRVAAAAPKQVKLEVFGKTGEGRELVAVVVSRDGQFDPAKLHAAGRPVVLIQNAIHAGEMDGKDACLALLRDILVTKKHAGLIERAVVVIIPIYNADGHERFGAFNRINQNGPEEMGWRVTARNLNLNRDYVKADAPETRAFLKLWNRWLPDFFVDNHVTDGADYQYDVTFGVGDYPAADADVARWQREVVEPYLSEEVNKSGHVAGPFIFLFDDTDPAKGIIRYPTQPRFADGYVVPQNRPGMLVEMHMLKDYKTRVTGNHEILRALLQLLNREADAVVRLARDADQRQVEAGKSYDPEKKVPLRMRSSDETVPFLFKGISYRRTLSEISGRMRVEYTGQPQDMTVPRTARIEVDHAVAAPRAYIVLAQWTPVIEVLEAHGLRLQRTTAPWTGEVETYRCANPRWLGRPFEGHHPMSTSTWGPDKITAECKPVREQLWFPAGSAVVPMDQRAAKIAMHWLEPEGPDSAMVWGLFDTIFEQKEYAEDYVLEKLAREMLDQDPKLKDEFERRVATDTAFAASSSQRLNFFFQRSPWWDRRLGLYPVGRLSTLDGVPVR